MRPKILNLMKIQKNKNIHIFKNRSDASIWLESL